MKERLYYLDNLKGLLIVLVILGHAIQFTMPDYENAFAFRLIYSFHMPLFLFISGYLASRGGYKQGVIKKRAIQLLLPFVTWALLSPILKEGTICLEKALCVLIYPDKGLWFLYNLFIYSAIASISEWLCEKYKVSKWLLIIGCYCALSLLMILFQTKFNCTQLCYHFVFYFAGYLYKHLSYVPKVSMVVMGGVIYAVLVPFWSTGGNPLFYDIINMGGAFAYLYRYGVQLLGMLFFFEIGRRYLKPQIRFLSQYGTMTLGVYALQFTVLHYLALFVPFTSQPIRIALETVLATFICFVLVNAIKRIPYLKIFLIGDI